MFKKYICGSEWEEVTWQRNQPHLEARNPYKRVAAVNDRFLLPLKYSGREMLR